MRVWTSYFAVALSCGICCCQSTNSRPDPTNIPEAEYPLQHSDSSLIFLVQADHAQRVQLLMELGQTTYDMARNQEGFWEVTTKPLLPGFHYYAISVDGFVSNDPGSRVFFAAQREVSGLEIPGPDSDFFAIHDVPHGSVRAQWYFSKITGDTRRVYVYTPPGYDQGSQRYPVLYLQHGYDENEAGWSDQGHENLILDNLIAAHKALPMIVVNENGLSEMHLQFPPPHKPGVAADQPTPRQTARFFTDKPYSLFDSVVSHDLVPFIDGNFRTIPDRQHCAIAGLSMGGAQALRIGFSHLDQFAWIGAFSPAISISDTKIDFRGDLSDSERINSQLRLLWIGIGVDDFLFDPVRDSHEVLEKVGVRHVWVETSGAQLWSVWRKYLADFLPRLFNE